MTTVSACTLDLSVGAWLLMFGSPVIWLLLPRCSVRVFFFFSTVLRRFHTLSWHTHVSALTSTHTNPGTCSHAEIPHCTSGGRPWNLLVCCCFITVCVFWQSCNSTPPASLLQMHFFLRLQFFFKELVWRITMLSLTKKKNLFAKR